MVKRQLRFQIFPDGVLSLSPPDQKLPLSKESAWAFLAFSHLLVGLCHPFPLTNSPFQIIIAHENEENATTAQFEFLGRISSQQGAR